MARSRQPRVLSAFTGAGGLDLGLEAAGFDVVLTIERDCIARKTLSLNRPGWVQHDSGDILELNPRKLRQKLGMDRGDLELLAGGPPCQPFSKAAQWKRRPGGILDDRSSTVYAFLELVREFLPKCVFIENVPGFARGQYAALPAIRNALTDIGRRTGCNYTVDYRIVNAADYGVPQRRERAVIVILRDDAAFKWPEPTHSKKPTRAWDALADVRVPDPPQAKGTWAGLLSSIPEGRNYIWHTDKGGGRPLFGYRTRFWSFLLKLAKAEPSWTLSAQPAQNAGPFHWENRPLAVEEMLRLQSFPRSWKLYGGYQTQVRQAGNATPPLLAEVIGRALAPQVFGAEVSGALRFRIARKRHIPPAERTSRVPNRYRAFEGTHAPHGGTGRGPRPLQ